ncbi:MAG: tRNA epoxyqueuosine(34) reductase QueG, partial [Fimbriimonadaceae bacterium]
RHLDMRRSPQTLLPDCQSILMVAANYNQQPERKPGEAKVARYALGKDYHRVIRKRLKAVMQGFQLEFGTFAHRICVDSAPLMEREFGHKAGLGWFGKNTMLIDSRRGSWFLLGAVLLSWKLPPDSPALGGCGTCSKCIEACPTGAIKLINGHWQVDSRQCISYLTIEKRGEFSPVELEDVGDWTFGCDICQEVCPFNQPRESQPLRAQPTSIAEFLQEGPTPTLTEVLNFSEAEWDRWSQGRAVRRARLDGIKRNAEANLRNLFSKPN